MDVFISWSGHRSGAVAKALREWLPQIINAIKPWLSSEDIEKGARWSTDIAVRLGKSTAGIICLTPSNLHSDWILFEAGALSKTLERTFVCPLLIGLEPSEVTGPLAQFQATRATEEDVLRLLKTLNVGLGESALPGGHIERAFEVWWPKLRNDIDELPEDGETADPKRSDRDLLEEILYLVRDQNRLAALAQIPPTQEPPNFGIKELVGAIADRIGAAGEDGVHADAIVSHFGGRGSPYPYGGPSWVIDHLISYGLVNVKLVSDKKVLKWNNTPGSHFNFASVIKHSEELWKRAQAAGAHGHDRQATS